MIQDLSREILSTVELHLGLLHTIGQIVKCQVRAPLLFQATQIVSLRIWLWSVPNKKILSSLNMDHIQSWSPRLFSMVFTAFKYV